MIHPNFKDFPRHGRIIGIDWGARRTGVAVSDETQEFFFERDPIVAPTRNGDMARAVADVVAAEKVMAIVVGVPLRADGTASDTTAAVYEFIARLETSCDRPIFMIDETLSSYTAQSDMGKCRVSDIKKKLDSAAARVILENAVALARRAG